MRPSGCWPPRPRPDDRATSPPKARTAVDDRPIHALGFAAAELILECRLRRRILREDHEARRVAVDAMDHERPSLPMRPQAIFDPSVHGGRVAAARERNSEQPCRLVEHDEHVVFEHRAQAVLVANLEPASRRARPIHPETNAVARGQAASGIHRRRIGVVDDDLAASDGFARAAAGPQTTGIGQELVEADPCVVGSDPRLPALSLKCLTRTQPPRGRARGGSGLPLAPLATSDYPDSNRSPAPRSPILSIDHPMAHFSWPIDPLPGLRSPRSWWTIRAAARDPPQALAGGRGQSRSATLPVDFPAGPRRRLGDGSRSAVHARPGTTPSRALASTPNASSARQCTTSSARTIRGTLPWRTIFRRSRASVARFSTSTTAGPTTS